jgi:tRNA(Arg) A34 adenosine deaminase TadA
VRLSTDATAHAEVNAIRAACRKIGDIFLEGAIVATTCEPCPMCMAALHWARVDTVYFGATIHDATASGFSELALPACDVVRLGHSRVQLVPGFLSDECRALFEEWKSSGEYKPY